MAIFMSIWHYQVIFCNIFIAFVSTTWQKYQMNGCKVLFGAIGFEVNFKKKQLMSANYACQYSAKCQIKRVLCQLFWRLHDEVGLKKGDLPFLV